ncbi:MAG: SDR family NAD(P)-dependent oxidoreductase [Proteobacteria bacterium]|nr:SDR family NAD(P)-dependent oxidoreductase [Pseudomonadota bacterium]
MTSFERPDWTPAIKNGTRLLITGASGGLGRALVDMLLDGPECVIGAHGATGQHPTDDKRVIHLTQKFETEADCVRLIDDFTTKAGGIDALVVLSGGIHFSGHWKDMPSDDWEKDVAVNLNQPFYLARAAMAHMKDQAGGGSILLTGTESALHGGSDQSFPYAVAKRGTECMVQGLAREGAPDGILVNGVRFGFITSGFHQRWHGKTEKDLAERADMVPLKRGGDPDEAAALMIYLLSGWATFITGQMIPLTGGDWL